MHDLAERRSTFQDPADRQRSARIVPARHAAAADDEHCRLLRLGQDDHGRDHPRAWRAASTRSGLSGGQVNISNGDFVISLIGELFDRERQADVAAQRRELDRQRPRGASVSVGTCSAVTSSSSRTVSGPAERTRQADTSERRHARRYGIASITVGRHEGMSLVRRRHGSDRSRSCATSAQLAVGSAKRRRRRRTFEALSSATAASSPSKVRLGQAELVQEAGIARARAVACCRGGQAPSPYERSAPKCSRRCASNRSRSRSLAEVDEFAWLRSVVTCFREELS